MSAVRPRAATSAPSPPPPARPATLDEAAARRHARDVVRRSGTSFFWGMRLLPQDQREAMYAIYAFCREVDDVADDELPPEGKLTQLAEWRAEIAALFAGLPSRATTRALQAPVRRYDLPEAEFHAMIDGMEMDAAERMQAPSWAELERYCRCVAGAVGLLSVRVFGARGEQVEASALALGEALQLTNILRDLAEDAARGRLYLPREELERHGIREREPGRVLRHPDLPAVCEAVALRARARFAEAGCWLAADRARLRPALIMMQIYRRTLERLIARGWRELDRPVRLGRAERLWLALRYGLL